MDQRQERLALIELHERDGRSARYVDVHAWPLRLGRALDNDVVIDDPHVAAHHALLEPDGQGGVQLRVLDTVNGVSVRGQRVAAGRQLSLPAAGAQLQLGGTRLRLRLPAEQLAPEQALRDLGRAQRLLPWAAGAALLALEAAEQWLSLDPGADYSAWLPLLAGVPGVLAAWCGIWALLSKLFQHRFDFIGHLRIALPRLLVMVAADALLPQIAAALDLPWLWQLTVPLQALLLALLVRAHLRHTLPGHDRMVTAAVASLALTAGALSLALTYRANDRYTAAPYMSTLPLPALRLAGTVPPSTLVDAMAPLAARLAQRVKKARADDEDEDGGDAASE